MKISSMGVVNLTPNSFSDGGKFSHPEDLKTFLKQNTFFDIWDFGAESTAPFNQAIQSQKEIERLESFLLPLLQEKKNWGRVSLDTYHIETMAWFLEKAKQNKVQFKELIWNDISGKLDEKCLELLKKHPGLSYVFSHNEALKREESSQHMNFVLQTVDIVQDLESYFRAGEKIIFKHSLKNKIYFDPCFGFSKSREDNHHLLLEIETLIKQFPKFHWVWGISRKSFLRFGEMQKKDQLFQAEVLQALFLERLLTKTKMLPGEMLIRLHDQRVMSAVSIFRSFLGSR